MAYHVPHFPEIPNWNDLRLERKILVIGILVFIAVIIIVTCIKIVENFKRRARLRLAAQNGMDAYK